MDAPDLPGRTHDQHQFVWFNLLFAGRAACQPRPGRGHSSRFDFIHESDRPYPALPPRTYRDDLLVLALRGLRLGRGYHGCLHHQRELLSPMDPHEHPGEGVDLPIPTANPIIAAFGITLMAAGIVTSLIVSLVGFIIGLIGAVGWFREVFPTPKHVLYPLAATDRRAKPVRVSPRRIEHLLYGQTSHRVRVP